MFFVFCLFCGLWASFGHVYCSRFLNKTRFDRNCCSHCSYMVYIERKGGNLLSLYVLAHLMLNASCHFFKTFATHFLSCPGLLARGYAWDAWPPEEHHRHQSDHEEDGTAGRHRKSRQDKDTSKEIYLYLKLSKLCNHIIFCCRAWRMSSWAATIPSRRRRTKPSTFRESMPHALS